MDITSALQNIQRGRKAILFLGAGFSNVSNNVIGLPTPSASQLAERILQHLKIQEQLRWALQWTNCAKNCLRERHLILSKTN